MLTIVIPKQEYWDEINNVFVESKKEYTLQLEHSLVSIAKWETKWCKSFFSKEDKTEDENIYYIKCMTLTQNVDPEAYQYLTDDNKRQITEYMTTPKTATTFPKTTNNKRNNELLTSELIYYYMVALTIPFECQKWPLERLLTLIRICNIKNQPPKKGRSKQEILSNNAAINAARRQKMGTMG